jgi:hypothetical protein
MKVRDSEENSVCSVDAEHTLFPRMLYIFTDQ